MILKSVFANKLLIFLYLLSFVSILCTAVHLLSLKYHKTLLENMSGLCVWMKAQIMGWNPEFLVLYKRVTQQQY